MERAGETGRIGARGALLSSRRVFPLPGRGEEALQPAPLGILEMAKRKEGSRELGGIAQPDGRVGCVRKVLEGSGFHWSGNPVTGRQLSRQYAARAKTLVEGGGLRVQGARRAGFDLGKPDRLVTGENEVFILDCMKDDPGIADTAGVDAVGKGGQNCHQYTNHLFQGDLRRRLDECR